MVIPSPKINNLILNYLVTNITTLIQLERHLNLTYIIVSILSKLNAYGFNQILNPNLN